MFDRIKDGMYWDRAYKLVEGCTPVSEGCAHCWSARETHMRAKNPNVVIAERNKGLTQNGFMRSGEKSASPFFSGTIRLREDNFGLPLLVKKPTAFAIWNDLFHEDVPDEFIVNAFRMMWTCNQHVFFVLTKRPERMQSVLELGEVVFVGDDMDFPPESVWIGVTTENQEQADKRIPILLQIPAAKRYVSIEPMLGPVDIGKYLPHDPRLFSERNNFKPFIDWVICGGESGPGARPMHPDWVRSLRDQCQAAGVPFFLKQMHIDGKLVKAPLLDGKCYLEIPHA